MTFLGGWLPVKSRETETMDMKGHIIGGEDLLRILGVAREDGSDREDVAPPQDPAAQIMDLQTLYQAYKTPNPFKPGDLIVPRPGLAIKSTSPAIVLEALEKPMKPEEMGAHTIWNEYAHSSGFLPRFDIRYLTTADRGSSVPFWGESWQFVRYEPNS